MDVATAGQVAQSPAVWALCCILLTGFIIKKMYEKNDQREDKLLQYHEEYRAESKEREGKLMDHLERSNESQERTSVALEGLNHAFAGLRDDVSDLADRVEYMEKNKKESA